MLTKNNGLTDLQSRASFRPLLVIGIALGSALFDQSVAAQDKPDLGAQWWQFMSSIPAEDNPLFDTTGAKCAVGQRGDTWFIGGVLGARDANTGDFIGGGGSATRDCTIPQGKKLFFPVINNAQFDSPSICGQDSNHVSFSDLVNLVKPVVDLATNMVVTLDGRRINGLQRITSESSFELTLPEANMWDQICTFFNLGNVPAGVYSPGFQDGYYKTIGPLRVGQHTLRIQGTDDQFHLDITYHLNVVPVSK